MESPQDDYYDFYCEYNEKLQNYFSYISCPVNMAGIIPSESAYFKVIRDLPDKSVLRYYHQTHLYELRVDYEDYMETLLSNHEYLDHIGKIFFHHFKISFYVPQDYKESSYNPLL